MKQIKHSNNSTKKLIQKVHRYKRLTQLVMQWHHSLSLLATQASPDRRLSVSWRQNALESAESRLNWRIWEEGMRRRAGKRLRSGRRGGASAGLCRKRGDVHQSCRESWRRRGRGWPNYWRRYRIILHEIFSAKDTWCFCPIFTYYLTFLKSRCIYFEKCTKSVLNYQ